VVIIKKMSCKTRFSYVVFKIVEVLFISFMERATCLANIFYMTVRTCKAEYSASFKLLLGVRVTWFVS
jgi:hypothetical protein